MEKRQRLVLPPLFFVLTGIELVCLLTIIALKPFATTRNGELNYPVFATELVVCIRLFWTFKVFVIINAARSERTNAAVPSSSPKDCR